MKCKDIISFLEQEAPLWLQENYDNSGLQWGDPESTVQKILVCLDFNSDALKEAIEKQVQLVISHHPILFQEIHYELEGAMLADCIKQHLYIPLIQILICDNGLNEYLAKTLELQTLGTENPYGQLYKLVVLCPKSLGAKAVLMPVQE